MSVCLVMEIAFFKANSHQLFRHEREHMIIRKNAIDFLKSHIRDYKEFVELLDSTFKRYINDMNKNGNYVDHTVISVTARFLQKQIVIHQHRQPPLVISSPVFSQEQLHVCYDPDSGHYESVVRFDNTQYFLSI
ncbi:unnamed protein product [Rotaria magnacalcarata]|uniref:OTU domain-containing protein n=2 Tax=Rotaria magnacalcarata TaxID=392030 RepID=A0A814IDW8_9BILA|nr:unnamed protein product [Rotaria magnacalcarata]CAF1928730.1 unnamed protein product [Rotaria magnacalcarata]CAF4237800.1 unnamed protein product [Rotaria magnacalcarata]CAF5087400.1 unnamed protein product [Rotaria magnacalcarata]